MPVLSLIAAAAEAVAPLSMSFERLMTLVDMLVAMLRIQSFPAHGV